jgi:4-hydroxy-3-methylbut-2-en-1-yl diphosphate synthase IspG/GcpE
VSLLLQIGNVNVGSEHPIALQTMTTTDTRDVEGTVEQVKKCADAGANLVRLTVQGKKEAEACFKIRERLFQVCLLQPALTGVSSTSQQCVHSLLGGSMQISQHQRV